MALGDTNNTGKRMYESTYYPRVSFFDAETNCKLSYTYRSGMVVFEIAKKKSDTDYESLINVFVTHTKAKIMVNQFKAFDEAVAAGKLDPNTAFGIVTGMKEVQTILAVHMGANGNPAITIAKVNKSGSYDSKYTFNFSKDYSFGINWSDINNMKCDKVFFNNLEYEQFKGIITQFAEAGYGGFAYSVADLTRYDTNSLKNKFNPIYTKMGIEIPGSGNRSYTPQDNYFNGNVSSRGSAATSQHMDYDDLANELSG